MAKNKKPHFEVHPSVVYQVGESLIRDAVQALIELVKSHCGADATHAKATIDMEEAVEVPGPSAPKKRSQAYTDDDKGIHPRIQKTVTCPSRLLQDNNMLFVLAALPVHHPLIR